MVKKLIKDIQSDFSDTALEEMSEEDAGEILSHLVENQIEHISNLESEKDSLSKANEELTASVEGYKSREEKLTKELEETKVKLTNTEGKLEQVTSMYKEQFTKDPEQQEQTVKDDTAFKNDVLQQILDTK